MLLPGAVQGLRYVRVGVNFFGKCDDCGDIHLLSMVRAFASPRAMPHSRGAHQIFFHARASLSFTLSGGVRVLRTQHENFMHYSLSIALER